MSEIYEKIQMQSIISPEYNYSVGRFMEKFYQGLKDAKIFGIKCSKCGLVYVPPRMVCHKCGKQMSDWVELAQKGKLKSFSTLYVTARKDKLDEPCTFGLIQLEGADSAIYSQLKGIPREQLKPGLELKAVWKEERKGAVEDLDHFTIA